MIHVLLNDSSPFIQKQLKWLSRDFQQWYSSQAYVMLVVGFQKLSNKTFAPLTMVSTTFLYYGSFQYSGTIQLQQLDTNSSSKKYTKICLFYQLFVFWVFLVSVFEAEILEIKSEDEMIGYVYDIRVKDVFRVCV